MSTDRELTDVKEAIMSWKRRQNQRYKILVFMVRKGNQWFTSETVRDGVTEIKDPGTVLYDMALRNPDDSPRGRGYYKRLQVYPSGYSSKPILEYDENFGYRIRPQFYSMIQQSI